jgi:tetratricopeptide (TPR) repeat protein
MKVNERMYFAAMAVVIAAITVVTWFPSLSNAYCGNEEKIFVTDNPIVAEKGWAAAESLLSPSWYREHGISYMPAALLSFGIEYALFEDNQRAFHCANMALHLLNCTLAFILLYLFGRSAGLSLIAVLLFSIHPVNAEAVASLSGRPVLLSGLFYLLSMICYLLYMRKGRLPFFWLSLVTAALTMASSPAGISLPLALMAIGRISGEDGQRARISNLLPFAVLSALSILMMALANGGLINGVYPLSATFSYLRSLCVTSYALLSILGRILLPFNLAAFYPYPDLLHMPAFLLLSPLIAGALLSLSLYAALSSRKAAPGIVLFFIPLLPQLHLFLEYDAISADMDAYLSSLGLFYLAALLLIAVAEKTGPYRKAVAVFSVTALVAVAVSCSVISHQRCAIWTDRESLQRDREVHIPETDREAAMNRKKLEGAVAELSSKLNMSGGADAKLRTERGILYMRSGDNEKAMADFCIAVKVSPDFAPAFFHRAALQCRTGHYEEAAGDYERAIQIDPSSIFIYLGRANVYAELGQLKKAIADYSFVLKNEPGNLEALINRATADASDGDFGKAAADLDEALQIAPDEPEALYRRGAIEIALGRENESVPYFRKIRTITGAVDPQRVTSFVTAFRKGAAGKKP